MSNKTVIAKDVQNWDDARKLIFDKIFEIVQEAKYRGPTFEIMSYMYLTTRLILRYHDCHQVFDFDYFDSGTTEPNTIEMSKFFTEDFTSEQKSSNSMDFADRYSRDKPEIKKAP